MAPKNSDALGPYRHSPDDRVVSIVSNRLKSVSDVLAETRERFERAAPETLTVVERSGAFRFPATFVRNFEPSGNEREDSETYETYRISNSIERHLPGAIETYEGAFRLLREYDPDIVERMGWEESIRTAFRSAKFGQVRKSPDRIPFGELRALVFSVYEFRYKKAKVPKWRIDSYEADVREEVRRATFPEGTGVELPRANPKTFRIFRNRFADVESVRIDRWPKEFGGERPNGGDLVLDLLPGAYLTGIFPTASEIFELYPEIERVFCATNGWGFLIPRWAPKTGGREELEPYLIAR